MQKKTVKILLVIQRLIEKAAILAVKLAHKALLLAAKAAHEAFKLARRVYCRHTRVKDITLPQKAKAGFGYYQCMKCNALLSSFRMSQRDRVFERRLIGRLHGK